MPWEFRSDLPIYAQIITQIQQRIVTGQLQPGDRLPSVRDLAAEAGVNPNTMQRAMAELEQEGLLVGGGTLGKFVTEEQSIVDNLRQKAVADAIAAAAARFRELGLSMEEAATLLTQHKEE